MEGERLSLAYKHLKKIPEKSLKNFEDKLIHLDLSHNKISDLRILVRLKQLRILILDHNHINSQIQFPSHEMLNTLWVNHNEIENLSIFIEKIAKAFPNLKYLSMMNNQAAPSYFNGGTLYQYTDYRQYTISHLPKLLALDDITITDEERFKAEQIYGKIRFDSSKKMDTCGYIDA
ncbi:Leucine-rich repeat-containing protein C10orf11-like protein [Trichoplax sp. H2]|nr:Leucine-rich repeat-containing protein C10orf11-like protein [Trichoplax sp. H2]|eukprot:RDD39808.1 Leucine-rich repeat-containing protein C10orf11-like protein [Trichoplax sp. H2]